MRGILLCAFVAISGCGIGGVKPKPSAAEYQTELMELERLEKDLQKKDEELAKWTKLANDAADLARRNAAIGEIEAADDNRQSALRITETVDEIRREREPLKAAIEDQQKRVDKMRKDRH